MLLGVSRCLEEPNDGIQAPDLKGVVLEGLPIGPQLFLSSWMLLLLLQVAGSQLSKQPTTTVTHWAILAL